MDPIKPPVLVLSAEQLPAFTGLAGWNLQVGFALPEQPWDLIDTKVLCTGSVDDLDTMEAALTAAARGAGLAVVVGLGGSARHRFLEDVAKVGQTVDYEPVADEALAGLDPDQRGLLAALARGETVTAAAAAAHVSRRTANRLLADARTKLDVDSNAEAARRWAAARDDAADAR